MSLIFDFCVNQEDVQQVGPKRVFNSDQSGVKKSLGSERTLDFKGVKGVSSRVQNIHATTHSYTVQPCINGDGELLEPTLLVLSEPKGTFWPIVSKNMFNERNHFDQILHQKVREKWATINAIYHCKSFLMELFVR